MPELPALPEKIESVQNAIKIAETLSLYENEKYEYWFRGHSKIIGQLIPKIFRDPYSLPTGLSSEFHLSYLFTQEAPAFIEKNPPYPDVHNKSAALEWLFLMQHHGLPTRLLDWTQNILVALYFAVEDDKLHNQTAELFAFSPSFLNKLTIKQPALLTLNDLNILYLANSAFSMDPIADVFSAFKYAINLPKYPLAFVPSKLFPRVSIQMSTFTIHPDKTNTDICAIEELKPKHLFRFVIPNYAKYDIKKTLDMIGIRNYSLFPGLDNLSSYLAKNMEDIKRENA